MITRRELLSGLGAGCACALAGLPVSARASAHEDGIVCTLFGGASFRGTRNVRVASAETLEAVNSVARALGIAQSFDVFEADIERWAGFAVIKKGKRNIVLDPKFLGRGWASIGLIGHEIGHHLHGHTVHRKKHSWGREMEADFTAGRAIAFMGGTLADAQSWWSSGNRKGTSTHPPDIVREKAVEAGWRHAKSQQA